MPRRENFSRLELLIERSDKLQLCVRRETIVESSTFRIGQVEEVKNMGNQGTGSGAHPFHYKRATDLIVPPSFCESDTIFSCTDYELAKLVTDIERDSKTGCIRAWNHRLSTRCLMLLHQGRIVGCLYGSRTVQETNTEISVRLMLWNLKDPDTTFTMYDLPGEVVLPLASLFIGKTLNHADYDDATAYFETWFEKKDQSACLTILSTTDAVTYLAFLHRGTFGGAFCVDDQKFFSEVHVIRDILETKPKTFIDACTLSTPEDADSQLGYALSAAVLSLHGPV